MPGRATSPAGPLQTDSSGTAFILSYPALLALALFGAAVLFWSDTLRAREVALKASRRACADLGVQLLDETVSLARLGVRRDGGRAVFRREYGFEFSVEGAERRRGRVAVQGRRVVGLQLDHPDGLVIL